MGYAAGVVRLFGCFSRLKISPSSILQEEYSFKVVTNPQSLLASEGAGGDQNKAEGEVIK